ncbi:hypothetical protein IGI04_023626 [Brassica rapa subsp. trilocularis]|uniref:Uncharacterized protein n=1 Tax=Brassica rapa subsp. trilocularis TaxID=1813537 RepID=A0ABQ7M4E9_BRACM|nr:hypothetical protein IGI04_023626 [Brassica rapa subsp. trilocularis]
MNQERLPVQVELQQEPQIMMRVPRALVEFVSRKYSVLLPMFSKGRKHGGDERERSRQARGSSEIEDTPVTSCEGSDYLRCISEIESVLVLPELYIESSDR